MRWYSAYCFEVTIKPNFDRIFTLFNDFFVRMSFRDNSSYIFYRIALKLGGQSDHDVVRFIYG